MVDKIMSTIFLGLVLIFGGFHVLFMLLLSYHWDYVRVIGVLVIVLYVAVVLGIFGFYSTVRRKQSVAIIGFIVVLFSIIPAAARFYDSQITTVNAEVNVWEYEPFVENSLVKQLKEGATVTIDEPLPILDGATAMYPLYAAFVQATYPRSLNYLQEEIVMVNKTPQAYENVINGKADMIFVAAPSQQQIDVAKSKNVELEMTAIGKEAFVFFVHKNNPINSLTLEQIRGIYSGDITNWSQVGGTNESIRAFQRPQDSGSQTALQYVMGDIPIMEAPTEDIVSGMGGIIHEVAQYKNYKNAIGYTFRYYSTEMVGNDEIKLLMIDDVAPTKENIRNETYPITSQFYAVTTDTDNPNVRKLLNWILSPQGQQLVEEVGYVPVLENNK
ncbi:substrate-binding domain-containing protein [Solibacillus sp. CAU 1738]|uniref:PstS family phosphate ABC transporter substrate-binding protein n=1 Tax=Solibacillus sp. CAU 1738 TaxID=3140363 RepID=UPI00326145DC